MHVRFVARRTPRLRPVFLMVLLLLTGLAALPRGAARVAAQEPAGTAEVEPAQIGPVAGRIAYVPIALDPVSVPPRSSVWITPSAANINPNSFFAVKVYAKNTSTSAEPFVSVLVTWNFSLASFERSEAGAGDFVVTQTNGISVQFSRELAPNEERTVTLVLRARPGVNNADIQFGGDFSAAANQAGYLNKINVFVGTTPPPPNVRFACLLGRGGAGPLGQNPGAGNNPFGTNYTFGAFRKSNGGCGFTFSPFARVSYWVAQPTGPSVPLNIYGNADTYGEVELRYNTSPLANVCPVNLCAFAMNAASNTNYVLVAPFNLARNASSTEQPAALPASVAAQPAAADPSQAVEPAQTTDPAADPGALGGLSGVVTGANAVPLEGVLVAVFVSGSDELVDSAVTDETGSYLIPAGLPSGSYQVLFSPGLGSNPETFDYVDATLPVTVTEPDIATLDAGLSLGSTISGSVTSDDTGLPLEDVLVLVYDATRSELLEVASTDDTGAYSTSALPSGNYVVEFDPAFSSEEEVNAYVGEYSNNQLLTTTTPATVALTAPAPLTGLNAGLSRCPTCGQISGRVTAQDGGEALSDVSVVVRNATNGSQVAVTSTDADGTYDVQVPSGSYTVEFFTDLSPLAETQSYLDGYRSTTPINVTAPNVVGNINGVLSRGGQFAGSVKAGDTDAGLNEVFIVVTNAAGQVVTTAFTDATGSFTSPALAAGNYTLTFRTVQSASEATRAYKETSVRATVAAPGSRSAPLSIELSR